MSSVNEYEASMHREVKLQRKRSETPVFVIQI